MGGDVCMCVCIGTLLTVNRCVGLLKQRLRLEVCLVRVPGAGVRMCTCLRSGKVRCEGFFIPAGEEYKEGTGERDWK